MISIYLRMSKYLTVLVLFSCLSCARVTDIYQACCVSNPVKINLVELKMNAKNLDGKQIEIIGYYKNDFELSGLFPDKSSEDKSGSIWVKFQKLPDLINTKSNKSLFDSGQMDKAYNKFIRIVGIYDNDSKGHLGNYLGTINNICRLEIYE